MVKDAATLPPAKIILQIAYHLDESPYDYKYTSINSFARAHRHLYNIVDRFCTGLMRRTAEREEKKNQKQTLFPSKPQLTHMGRASSEQHLKPFFFFFLEDFP